MLKKKTASQLPFSDPTLGSEGGRPEGAYGSGRWRGYSVNDRDISATRDLRGIRITSSGGAAQGRQ